MEVNYMRIKFLVLALVASLVAVSAAIAKDNPGKGHKSPPAAAGTNCKMAKVELKGMLAADVDPADGDTSFVMVVKRANRHGKAFKAAGSATVTVDAKTKVRRKGEHTLGALAPNDRLSVQGRVCRTDLAEGATPQLTARKINARPAKAEHPAKPAKSA
jgi:hypothetical protein